jgi:hypothetical protein
LLLGAHRVFDGALFAFFIALREAFFACGALVFFGALMVLAFPCFLIGLLGMPLCGAALTFFAPQGLPSGRRRKESKQRKRASNR